MPHLLTLSLDAGRANASDRFPFSVPIIRELGTLAFDAPVTFLVGENGSGKSTLLEALALAAKLPTVGSESSDRDKTLEAQRRLARALKLTWRQKVHRGFFLRAEDFFGFTKALAKMRADMLEDLARIEVEYKDRDYARGFARLPALTTLHDMERRYGIDLDENSHGQSFLKLFRSRFVPGGLYLLDEPEAPLSPQSQLALLVMIGDMVQQNAQFIIATHSPILLGFPKATIYSCDRVPIERVPFDELDHVVITREFLNAPGRFLRHLESGPATRDPA
jgi:predicted ATPase